MSTQRSTDLLVAFGIGVALGAVTVLLLAPASGEQTRERLSRWGENVKGRALEGADGVKQIASDQRKRLEQAIQEGKKAYLREASDTLT